MDLGRELTATTPGPTNPHPCQVGLSIPDSKGRLPLSSTTPGPTNPHPWQVGLSIPDSNGGSHGKAVFNSHPDKNMSVPHQDIGCRHQGTKVCAKWK